MILAQARRCGEMGREEGDCVERRVVKRKEGGRRKRGRDQVDAKQRTEVVQQHALVRGMCGKV